MGSALGASLTTHNRNPQEVFSDENDSGHGFSGEGDGPNGWTGVLYSFCFDQTW